MVGVVFALPLIFLAFPDAVRHAVEKFLPELIAENSLTAVKPVAHSLPPWAGAGRAGRVRRGHAAGGRLAAGPAGRRGGTMTPWVTRSR